MENNFKVLAYDGDFVDETKLSEGIYTTLTPRLRIATETIETMLLRFEGQKYMEESPMGKYIKNLKQCTLINCTLKINHP